MNKKGKWMLTMAGAGIIGMLSGCGSSQVYELPSVPSTNEESDSAKPGTPEKDATPTQSNLQRKEVYTLTDSEEEAKRIAELYDIELTSFGLGVAIYSTDKDVAALIQMGKDNGYPELTLNHEVHAFE